MYTIFQNDLSFFVKSSLSRYADDHQMFHVGNDQSSVTLELRETARNATNWYDSNLLARNLKNYHTKNIGDSEDKNSVTYTICVKNEEIKTLGKLDHLDVFLDSKLNFTDHISLICKKASQRIGAYATIRAKLVLCKTAILPFLLYCQLNWHFCKASDSRKIERLQERGLRPVYKDHHATYSELLKRAEPPTLKNRRLQDMHPYV